MFLLAPTWGATAMTLDSGALNRISTHAPAWGATPTGADIQHLYGNKYRRQVKADAIARLGMDDTHPVLLLQLALGSSIQQVTEAKGRRCA